MPESLAVQPAVAAEVGARLDVAYDQALTASVIGHHLITEDEQAQLTQALETLRAVSTRLLPE